MARSACADGKVERITTAGEVTAYPVPSPFSFPPGFTAGPDGAVWFTELGTGKIWRIAVPTGLEASLKVSPLRVVGRRGQGQGDG